MPQLPGLRDRIDQMDKRIVIGLRQRSLLPLNRKIYERDAIRIEGRKGISLLDFALERFEACGALFDIVPEGDILDVPIDFRDDLICFYTSTLLDMCTGDDPPTYGETVLNDMGLLVLLTHRIYMGVYVAEAKLQEDPSIRNHINNQELLAEKMRNSRREEDVIQQVKFMTLDYGWKPDFVEKFFRYIIERTLNVEVAYVQKKCVTA